VSPPTHPARLSDLPHWPPRGQSEPGIRAPAAMRTSMGPLWEKESLYAGGARGSVEEVPWVSLVVARSWARPNPPFPAHRALRVAASSQITPASANMHTFIKTFSSLLLFFYLVQRCLCDSNKRVIVFVSYYRSSLMNNIFALFCRREST
jgi:hypothetical protein